MTGCYARLERWAEIHEFPNYMVSDQGRVKNRKTDRMVTPTVNARGASVVGLMCEGKQYKRSLALLVASHYVPAYPNPVFNTPTHHDHDRQNNHFQNLSWRPLWFAREYGQQLIHMRYTYPNPIVEVESGMKFNNSLEASNHYCVLDKDIVFAILNNGRVWPFGLVFQKL